MADKTILVVDDEPEVLNLLVETMAGAGYGVITAENGVSTLKAVRDSMPDLLVLDLMLPDMDGLEVCRQIRTTPGMLKLPIIMLTARHTLGDRIAGLEQGADIYVSKPFEPSELVAQVKSLFRRLSFSSSIIKKGSFEINPRYNRVTIGGIEVTGLSQREFNSLYALMEAAPGSVERSVLYAKIWDEGEYPDTTRRIDMMIQRLRQKLGKRGSSHVKTVGGIGYKFEE